MKAAVATTAETPIPTLTTMVESPSTKIRASPKSTLYRFPPEIRKELFKAVLTLFFQEFPERQGIICEVDKRGIPFLSPDTPNGFLTLPGQNEKLYAGQYERLLPGLEVALFADTKLYDEFITTRIEESTLILRPRVISDFRHGPGQGLPGLVVWPRVNVVSWQVRRSVRSVTYVLDIGPKHLELGFLLEWPIDWYQRMQMLARALESSLYKSPVAYHTQDSKDAPVRPESACVLLPLLNNITIRFQDASREGRGQLFMIFENDREMFFRGLSTVIRDVRIKSFQLEDLRDFKAPGSRPNFNNQMPLGLMDDPGPRFGKFTTELDRVFGIERKDGTEIDHEDIGGRGEGWEIYKAKETWTATGDYLSWKY